MPATTTTPAVPEAHNPNIPCFVCHYEWLANVTDGTADRYYAGCECNHCANPVEPDVAAPIADHSHRMTRFTVQAEAADYSTHVTNVFLCPDHADARSSMRYLPQCRWCGQNTVTAELTPATSGDDMSQAFMSTDWHGTPYRWSTGERGGAVRDSWSDGYARMGNLYPRSSVRLPEDSTACLCTNCADAAIGCDDCGRIMSAHDCNRCVECAVSLCYSCYDNNGHEGHDEYDDEDGYGGSDQGRSSFRARASIADALATAGQPGLTVLSTRALGVEIESSRGDCAPVIRAEAEGVIPVLAGVGSDGSVAGANAVEYRLLPLRGLWAEYGIQGMNRWCREANYAPDNSAGVHMHVDCSNLSVQGVWAAFAALVALQPALYGLAAAERLTNRYCRPYENTTSIVRRALVNAESDHTYFDVGFSGQRDRYFGINCHSHSGHGTLEVRIFDTDHSEQSVERYLDAAALISGVVDFTTTPAWHLFVDMARESEADVALAVVLMDAMVAGGHLTQGTVDRVAARLGLAVAVAA